MSTLAEKITRACRDGGLIDWSAADLPADIAAAMRVQADVARRAGVSVAGWKVAVPPGQPAVAAPIFASLCVESGSALTLPPGQGLAVEVELCVRLTRDVPARPHKPYAVAEIKDAFDELCIGIEICPLRFASEPPVPFPLHLANNMANGGYVLGPRLGKERLREPPVWPVTILRDGATIYQAAGYHADGDPLIPLAAYLSRPIDVMGGLRAGQFVTTGSFCGAVATQGKAEFTARLGNLGEARVTLR